MASVEMSAGLLPGEGREGSGKRLFVRERGIPRKKNIMYIIVMVHSENDNTLKLSIFLWYCSTFSSAQKTLLENQPV